MGMYIRGFVLGICVGYIWRKATEPKEQWSYLAWRERRKSA